MLYFGNIPQVFRLATGMTNISVNAYKSVGQFSAKSFWG